MKRMMLTGVTCMLLTCWVLAQTGPGEAPAPDEKTTTETSMVTSQGTSAGRYWALRLRPGADLRRELENAAREHGWRAAAIVSAVGSLDGAALRFADMKETALISGKLEIVSLIGTLGDGGVHLHLAASDGAGRTVGGHLQAGCKVRTTAEIVVVELTDLTFERAEDAETGYRELVIQPRD